jgi:acylphosphatase
MDYVGVLSHSGYIFLETICCSACSRVRQPVVQSARLRSYRNLILSGEQDPLCAVHVIVQGHVQGVSFRYYTLLRARELSVIGWVRNLPDGTVEVLAEGSQSQLDQLTEYLNTGPIGARVEAVMRNWQSATGQFTDFIIR